MGVITVYCIYVQRVYTYIYTGLCYFTIALTYTSGRPFSKYTSALKRERRSTNRNSLCRNLHGRRRWIRIARTPYCTRTCVAIEADKRKRSTLPRFPSIQNVFATIRTGARFSLTNNPGDGSTTSDRLRHGFDRSGRRRK